MSDDTQPARANVGPGDKVAGYLLEEQIGQGGMAVVYRAYDERLDRRVALKVLAPSLAADNAFRTRFIRESRAAATVEHPNIIPVYDAGDAGGCLFISMRYVQGGDVRSLLADGKGLPPARAWNIITQVGSALDMAHSHNLVHRDVKPANMLIDASAKTLPARRGDPPEPPAPQRDVNTSGPVTEHIYLSDFGISKQTVASNLTSTGQFVGTLDYIAPEQIEGQAIDGRADQYSLACAAFELLCGIPPFTGPNIFALINSHLSEQPPLVSKLQPGLPASLDRVLNKAMAKSPARRYATCAQFAADLGRALGLVPGPLEADSGQSAGPVAGTAAPGKPHQATELAGPAVAAAAGAAAAGAAAGVGAAAAGAAAGVGATPTAQETPGIPGQAVTASPGAVPEVAGAQAVIDQQTMTAGQSGQAMQAPPGTGQQASTDQQWQGQQWQQQTPPGQQWQQQTPPGQQWHGQQWQGQQWQGQQWQAGPGPGQPGPYGQQQNAPFQTYPQPGGPIGPTTPGFPNYQPQQPRKSRGMLIGGLVGALVVAAAAAAVAVTVLNHGGNNGNGPVNGSSSSAPPGSSTPAAAGQTQADAISSLLSAMMQSHQTLQAAVLDIEDNCSSLSPSQMSSDVAAIQTAAGQRQSEYSRAQGLTVSALPSGATAKANLTRALFYSRQADNNYLTWGQEEQSGCFVSSQSSAYNAANSDSVQANAAKSNFANIWNDQIAPSYNEPTVVPGTL